MHKYKHIPSRYTYHFASIDMNEYTNIILLLCRRNYVVSLSPPVARLFANCHLALPSHSRGNYYLTQLIHPIQRAIRIILLYNYSQSFILLQSTALSVKVDLYKKEDTNKLKKSYVPPFYLIPVPHHYTTTYRLYYIICSNLY